MENKTINIENLIKDLEQEKPEANIIVINYLNAIQSYTSILLGFDKDIISLETEKEKQSRKLSSILSLYERINPMFLCKYFVLKSTYTKELVGDFCNIVFDLQSCTEEYLGLFDSNCDEEVLKEKTISYESEISKLVDEYNKELKEVMRKDMIESHMKQKD